jgi:cell division protein ZapA
MPLVNVMLNSRAYTIACDAGEEEHLKELAAYVDQKVRELTGTVGQVGDQKLLLMAAVLITDELLEARTRLDGHAKKEGELSHAQTEFSRRADRAEQTAAGALEDAAKRLESIVEKLKAA